MKKSIFLVQLAVVVFLIEACSPKTQAPVHFLKVKETTYEQVLAEAKAKKKLVFMDFYTTWCGPCKWMDTNVFSDGEVGSTFKKNFISYKVDAEDFDGVNLALKYHVNAYPTLIFTDAEGTVIQRIEGMIPKESFLQIAKEVKEE